MSSIPTLACDACVPGYPGTGWSRTGEVALTTPLHVAWSQPGLHVLVGTNGSGKSTLIRTLAGLQPPVSGRVLLGDTPLHQCTARYRAEQLAFVDSVPPRASGLTVMEVLRLARPEVPLEAAMDWLVRLGDPRWADARLSTLSDGQAQRVMVIRAAVQNTSWMFLDEPTAFLDVPARLNLMNVVGEMATGGGALMMTTHDLHLIHAHPHLRSLHLLSAGGLTPLDPAGSVKDWENQLLGASAASNKSFGR